MRSFLVLTLLFAFGCSESEPPPEEPAVRYSTGRTTTPDGVELLILHDDEAGLEASVAPAKGGELSGLRVKVGDEMVETIYRAEDYAPREGWTGKAPLLWPAVGRNFPKGFTPQQKPDGTIERGRYTLDGKNYEMPGHGFARDYPWQVEGFGTQDGAFAEVSFEDNDETRVYYPFGFRLTATYRLSEGALIIAYNVAAKEDNTRPMPFSIGNHITFNAPLLEGSDAGAMTLTTASSAELLKDGGIPTGDTRPRSHADGIQLKDFEVREAVSLTGYQGEPIVTLRDPGGLAIRISHSAERWASEPYVPFNLWGDAAGGFFSPEPWVGLQNSHVLKKGLVELAPGEDWDWTIRVEPIRE